eukprot:gene10539-11651_t
MSSDEDSDEISLKDDSTGLPILLLGAEEPIPKYEHVLVPSRIATGRKRSGTGEVQESGTVTPLLPANETVADGDDTNPPWEFADDLNDASDVMVSSEIRRFQVLQRILFKLNSGDAWILSCSCSESHEKYVNTLDKTLNVDYEGLRKIVNEHYKECLHVVVGYDLINISDSLNDVDPFQVIPGAGPEHAYVKEVPVVSELPFSAAELTLVKPKDKPFAVVGCDRKGFKMRVLLDNKECRELLTAYAEGNDKMLQVARMKDIKSGLDIAKFPDKLHRLQCSAPIIFGVISHFPERTPPVSALQLFAMLEEKVEKTFQRQPHFLEPANEEEQGTEFSFLPNWPRKTQRGIYFQDFQGFKRQDSVTCNKV